MMVTEELLDETVEWLREDGLDEPVDNFTKGSFVDDWVFVFSSDREGASEVFEALKRTGRIERTRVRGYRGWRLV